MTLFLRELKANRKSLVIWSTVCIGLIIFSMSMFPYFAEQGKDLNELMSGFPEEMLEALNANNLDFSDAMQYFSYIYQYILLAAGIMAMLLGVSTVAKEEGESTIEFLYSKPVGRNYILSGKAAFVLTQNLIFSCLIIAASWIMLISLSDKSVNAGAVLLLGLSTYLIQIFFSGLGIMTGIFVTRTRRYMPVSLGAVFIMYFTAMLSSLRNDLNFLKFLSPFSFFESRSILTKASIDGKGILIVAIAVMAFVCTAYLVYNKKDFKN